MTLSALAFLIACSASAAAPKVIVPAGTGLILTSAVRLVPAPQLSGPGLAFSPAPGLLAPALSAAPLPAAPLADVAAEPGPSDGLGSLGGLQAAAHELARRSGETAPLDALFAGAQVSQTPTWLFDAEKGFRPPADFHGTPPGCVIAKAAPQVKFPSQVSYQGRAYRHLRNGFYIGAHATDRDIAGLFDVLAPDYEQKEISVGFNRKVYAGLAETASLARERAPVDAVLDFGSGTGVSAPVLRRAFPGAVLYAFDLSPKMRELSAQKGMTPVSETRGRIELPDASVDATVGAFVLHLVRSPEWINELARILKPGGTAAFNVYKAASGWRQLYGRWFEAAGLEVVSLPGGEDKTLTAELSMPVMVVRKR